jgi:hypothetical protein
VRTVEPTENVLLASRAITRSRSESCWREAWAEFQRESDAYLKSYEAGIRAHLARLDQ